MTGTASASVSRGEGEGGEGALFWVVGKGEEKRRGERLEV